MKKPKHESRAEDLYGVSPQVRVRARAPKNSCVDAFARITILQERAAETTPDEFGNVPKARTLQEFAEDMVRLGVTPRVMSRNWYAKLFSGEIDPNIVDPSSGLPFDRSTLPRGHRGTRKGRLTNQLLDRKTDELVAAIRTLRATVEELGGQLVAVRAQVVKLEASQFHLAPSTTNSGATWTGGYILPKGGAHGE